MKPITLVLLICIMASCTKTQERQRESFKFVGVVKDCNGNPIKKAKVTVEARHLTWVVSSVDEVGSAYTNSDGYYEIQPYKTEMFDPEDPYKNVYRINASYGEYRERHVTIHNDSIRFTGADFYTIDLTLCD